MKHQLPQSARDALAHQTAGDEHPSADLLNAFLEHALAADENARVTTHLTSCADCREIVFLSSAANQDEQCAIAAQQYPAFYPRSRWASWKWLAPTLAALAIFVGVIVYRVTTVNPPAPTLAVNQPPTPPRAQRAAAPQENPTAATPPRFSASQKPSSPVQAEPRDMSKKKDLALQPHIAGSFDEKQAAAAATAAPPPLISPLSKSLPQSAAGASSGANSVGGPSAAPLAQNFPAQSQAQANIAAPPNEVPSRSSDEAAVVVTTPGAPTFDTMGRNPAGIAGGNSIAYAKRATVPAPHWRVSNDGHLQRSTSPGEWTPMLAEHPVTFHAVAVIGTEVWAGGSGGALFHSSDAGEHWTKVALTTDGQSEHGAVQSIRFDTSDQGRVTTEAATWSTHDGGKTWTRE
jgi:hypothetical protein